MLRRDTGMNPSLKEAPGRYKRLKDGTHFRLPFRMASRSMEIRQQVWPW